jgi:hypothetical protein
MPLDPLDPSEFITEPMTRSPVLQIDPAAGAFHARGPSLPAARPRPPQISEKAETALEQPAGFEQHMIGTRLPTPPNLATQPQPRIADIETMRATPSREGKAPYLDRVVDLFRAYPSTPSAWRKLDTETLLHNTIEQMKDNILWLHDRMPQAWRDRAQLWYDGGNRIINRWAEYYNLSPRATAGAAAALSPQKDWFENVSVAERVLRTVTDPQIRGTAMTPEMTALWQRLDKPEWGQFYKGIAGKSYDQIEAELQQTPLSPLAQATYKALWLRLYDEAHTAQSFRIVTPEGEFAGEKLNADGTPAKLRWNALPDIGKAIRMIETNGADAEILAGGMHKVRNFYNNLLAPNSPRGDVTIDTHAVAAALLRALSSKDTEPAHAMGSSLRAGMPTPPGSDITGMRGAYPVYAEAYRRAAAERGILPRQMQSITWEAVRGLYPRTFKKGNKELIDNLWKRYANGQATIEQTRDTIWQLTNGINRPDWAAGSSGGANELFQYSGDPRELFEPRVYGEPAGYPFVGGGTEPTAGAATPGVSDDAAAAIGFGAQ